LRGEVRLGQGGVVSGHGGVRDLKSKANSMVSSPWQAWSQGCAGDTIYILALASKQGSEAFPLHFAGFSDGA
jgi:hypothetical protein